MTTSDDLLKTLLMDCALGNHAAFERFYRLTSAKLFTLCRQMLRREALAEEALQEAFVQIWRDAATFDPQRSLAMAWVGTIVRHRCLDLLRKRRSEFPLAEDASDIVDEDAGPLELVAHWSDQYALGNCLQSLSKQQRVSVTMAFYRGLTHQEVSDYLVTPIGTVKSWIRRGLEQLRKCLDR
jgi:RNA polymerase sigma-70 factor (ECF subfamily)